MAAPEYRRIIERLREIATQAEGDMRTLETDRFREGIPEGLDHDEQTRRTYDGPRIEVRPLRRLPGRTHPPTGSKQIRQIEVELRVVRAMPLEVFDPDPSDGDGARYDVHGLAAEDGELLAQALELPQNLERTVAGELTGLRFLRPAGSPPRVVAPAGGDRPQTLETIHRFRGWCVIDVNANEELLTEAGEIITTEDGDALLVGR